jgi:hypothetical protein
MAPLYRPTKSRAVRFDHALLLLRNASAYTCRFRELEDVYNLMKHCGAGVGATVHSFTAKTRTRGEKKTRQQTQLRQWQRRLTAPRGVGGRTCVPHGEGLGFPVVVVGPRRWILSTLHPVLIKPSPFVVLCDPSVPVFPSSKDELALAGQRDLHRPRFAASAFAFAFHPPPRCRLNPADGF